MESFGTVDGPGIRFVLFLQGCPMRCLYCHNPDTWKGRQGIKVTPEEVLARYRKNKAFYSKGGLTVTGGEPLMQLPFLSELFVLAKQEGIHTCLDTSGAVFRENDPTYRKRLDRLLDNTDLVLLDIKHIDSDRHYALTGQENAHVLAFARYLSERQIPMWIRHVVVPGYTDDPADLEALGQFIATLRSVKALDVLPYHTMGVEKYKELNMKYPLEGVEALTKEAAKAAREHILNGIRKAHQNA